MIPNDAVKFLRTLHEMFGSRQRLGWDDYVHLAGTDVEIGQLYTWASRPYRQFKARPVSPRATARLVKLQKEAM